MSKQCNTVHHVTFTLCLFLLMCFSIQSVLADGTSELSNPAISLPEITALSDLPISFTENMGQAPEEVAFLIQSAGYLFGFTHDGFYFIPSNESLETLPATKMTIEGTNQNSSITGTELLPGVANYFIGSDESKWITDIPTYEGIVYNSVLPGVSLSYTGTEGILKREFTLDPGIEPETIVLAYDGIDSLELAEDGTLLVHTQSGIMSESAPISYQIIDDIRTELPSRFILLPENKISFEVDGYDSSLPLIIDPYLYYSTMLGGGMDDVALDMALDANGNVYLTGYTSSLNFPIQNQINSAINPVYNGSTLQGTTDAFVTMIGTSATGNATIIFSTYLGGEVSEKGYGIALDPAGNIYVTGETLSKNFPVKNPVQNGADWRGSSDVFLTKLTLGGTQLIYSTYIGGNGEDIANAIYVDSAGNAYITGKTKGNSPTHLPSSYRYPATSGAYQTEPSFTNNVQSDVFVTMVSHTSGTPIIQYSTYLSGNSEDTGKDLVVDTTGNIYIVGTTSSVDLVPQNVPGIQKQMGSSRDAFVFKLDPKAPKENQVIYATYLGGENNDDGEAIAIDIANNVYVAGETSSINFPVTDNAYQKGKAYWPQLFDTDIFVSKIKTDGTSFEYSTYLGGSKNDFVRDISVDAQNQTYVAGYTYSNDYPLLDSFKNRISDQDALVTTLSADGSKLIFSTIFGGHMDDGAHAVQVSASGEVYVAGYSNSPTFPQMNCDPNCFNEAFPAVRWIDQTLPYSGVYSGGNRTGMADAFVMKFSPADPELFNIDFMGDILIGYAPFDTTFTAFFYGTGTVTEADIIRWTWNFGDGGMNATTTNVPVINNYSAPGKYSVQLIACTRGGVCETAQKISYVIAEDPLANITVPNNPVTTMEVGVIENTSFQLRWTSSMPLPDLITWNLVGPGGETFDFTTTNSLLLTIPDGLTPPGLYTVTATPYYGTSLSQVQGTPIVRTDYINVLARPKIEFNGTATGTVFQMGPLYVHPNTVVQLRVSDLEYGIDRIQWDYGDGTSSALMSVPPNSNTTTHRYTTVGEYRPSVTIHNTTMRIQTTSEMLDAHRVIVYDPVIPDFTWTPQMPVVGESILFLDQSTGAPVTWFWEFGDGDTSALQNPIHAYAASGNYTVIFAAEDIAGRTHSVTKVIQILPASPDLVTLTWDPLVLPLADSATRDVSVILDAPIHGLITTEFVATIANESVAAFTGKSTPSFWEDKFTLTPIGNPPYKSVHIYAISYAGYPSSTTKLPIGLLEIVGVADGVTNMIFTNPEIAYGVMNSTYPVRVDSAQIIVKTVTYPILPFPGMKGPQADLDGDGLIDDFNGDGLVNAFDVIVFFDAYVAGYLNPVLLYDYNGNGRLDLQDIVMFYDSWRALNALAMMLGDDYDE